MCFDFNHAKLLNYQDELCMTNLVTFNVYLDVLFQKSLLTVHPHHLQFPMISHQYLYSTVSLVHVLFITLKL